MEKSGAATQLKRKETNTHATTSDLSRDGVVEISSSLRQLLADVFALYLKTKNFHWHMIGRHLRSAPSAISHDTNVCKTITKNRLVRKRCWKSSLPTTSS